MENELKALLEKLDAPVYEVNPDKMKNSRFTILVLLYAFGQFRIKITDLEQPCIFAPAGHGAIVREL